MVTRDQLKSHIDAYMNRGVALERQITKRKLTLAVFNLAFFSAFFVGQYFTLFNIGYHGFDTFSFGDDGQVGAAAFFAVTLIIGFASIPAKCMSGSWTQKSAAGPQRFGINYMSFCIVSLLLGTPLALVCARQSSLDTIASKGVVDLATVYGQMNTCLNTPPAAYYNLPAPLVSWTRIDLSSLGMTYTYFPVVATIYSYRLRHDENSTCMPNGLLYIAVAGRNATIAANETALSYRSPLNIVYFNENQDAYGEWYSPSNLPWAQYRIPLINGDVDETPEENTQRLMDYSGYRNDLMYVASFVWFGFFLLSLLPQTKVAWTITAAVAVVALNPLVVLAAGVVCSLHASKPDWALCDDDAGLGLIATGSVLVMWVVAAIVGGGN